MNLIADWQHHDHKREKLRKRLLEKGVDVETMYGGRHRSLRSQSKPEKEEIVADKLDRIGLVDETDFVMVDSDAGDGLSQQEKDDEWDLVGPDIAYDEFQISPLNLLPATITDHPPRTRAELIAPPSSLLCSSNAPDIVLPPPFSGGCGIAITKPLPPRAFLGASESDPRFDTDSRGRAYNPDVHDIRVKPTDLGELDAYDPDRHDIPIPPPWAVPRGFNTSNATVEDLKHYSTAPSTPRTPLPLTFPRSSMISAASSHGPVSPDIMPVQPFERPADLHSALPRRTRSCQGLSCAVLTIQSKNLPSCCHCLGNLQEMIQAHRTDGRHCGTVMAYRGDGKRREKRKLVIWREDTGFERWYSRLA